MSIPMKRFPNHAYVTYRSLRKQIKNGDVLLCSGSGYFSIMIQKATGSIWSHVAFIIRLDEIDRVMLLESVEPIGVRTVRLSKYLRDYDSKGHAYPGGLAVIRHKQFDATVNQAGLKVLAKYAVDQFGYPYDKDEIAKIAARILKGKLPYGPKELEKIKPDREFICSEYVDRCYQQVGLEVKWNKLGFVAPADFAKDKNFSLIGVIKKKP